MCIVFRLGNINLRKYLFLVLLGEFLMMVVNEITVGSSLKSKL